MPGKMYELGAIDTAWNEMMEKETHIPHQVEEGTLGYGHIIMEPVSDDYYWIEIEEIYLNPWSSGHTVKRSRKASKRMLDLIEKADAELID